MEDYFQTPITIIPPIFHFLEWTHNVKNGGRWYFLFESNKIYIPKISWKNCSHFLSFVTTIPPSNILLLRVIMYVHRKEANGNPISGRLTIAKITELISVHWELTLDLLANLILSILLYIHCYTFCSFSAKWICLLSRVWVFIGTPLQIQSLSRKGRLPFAWDYIFRVSVIKIY